MTHLLRLHLKNDELQQLTRLGGPFTCAVPCAGIRGVRLGKELMSVAANGLKLNMTRLGPLVLPLSEQLLFAGNMIARMLLGPKKVKPYVPDFGLAFNHICLHTGAH
jgi:hypothetical protein